jgi:hypothetical protein
MMDMFQVCDECAVAGACCEVEGKGSHAKKSQKISTSTHSYHFG